MLLNRLRRNESSGIFAIQVGVVTVNIACDENIAKQILAEKESSLNYEPIAWKIAQRISGVPHQSREKHNLSWEKYKSIYQYLINKPHVEKITKRISLLLEQNIPQMVSFLETSIDLQPWERCANASLISPNQSEMSLMPLIHMMMGYASVSAIFGSEILERYPDLIETLDEMDKGIQYFLWGLPAWLPWPGVMKSHIARYKLWKYMDDYEIALDNILSCKPNECSWGDLEDVSDFIKARHKFLKENGFNIKERADIGVRFTKPFELNVLTRLDSLGFNIQHKYVGLVKSIRDEINLYALVTPGITIGKFSEAPRLSLNPKMLSKSCPQLRAALFETLRLHSKAWSVRAVSEDIEISNNQKELGFAPFHLNKGEYVVIPNSVHMNDPTYYRDPLSFKPERFLTYNDDGSISANVDAIRPFGGGSSACKGQEIAENECLLLVAGVVTYWEIEPANEVSGWVVPNKVGSSYISRPAHDVRVKIKRRKFPWE
ncbi:Putative Cytochrome P450 [Blumeria hordei DH14]|uniref:Putative Cytochrome P450 n=1 Tax=Blumeria graminis f. sp. hordei (strain DH14) TaxID=546991 RepID=N1JHH4_BLUG1|nr:Putative Cytochrome P450 [Blumeria hordei DH14]